MGSEQPKPAVSPKRQPLQERLRALELDDKPAANADGFVEVDAMDPLDVRQLASWQAKLLEDPKNRLALSALAAACPRDVLTSREAKMADLHVYNVRIPCEGPPSTDQRRSGAAAVAGWLRPPMSSAWHWCTSTTWRRWSSARRTCSSGTFEARARERDMDWMAVVPVVEKKRPPHNVNAVKPPRDKLEKANYFLEQIIDTADQDLDSRLVQTLLQAPLADGGQWDMVHNLVAKYGLVPQALYPDSFNAKSSAVINAIIFTKLREDTLLLRALLASRSTTAAAIAATKAEMLREIHTILTLTLGPPPAPSAPFTWQFADTSGKTQQVRATPLAFAAGIWSPSPTTSTITSTTTAHGLAALVSLVHDPPHTLLRVDRLGNVVGGRGVTYINVEMRALKAACVAMLRAGRPVFFGSDVGKCSDRAASGGGGLMDLALVDYELGFSVGLLGMDKASRLRTGESAMTHAMVLTGVHVVDATGETVRWRVQNSGAAELGEGGWFVMTDAWMDEWVYQAVVDLKFLSPEVRKVLDRDPVVLPLWDPMGSLA